MTLEGKEGMEGNVADWWGSPVHRNITPWPGGLRSSCVDPDHSENSQRIGCSSTASAWRVA